jgi:hypothetical protein
MLSRWHPALRGLRTTSCPLALAFESADCSFACQFALQSGLRAA